jgi:hypothetical protein
LAGPAEDVVEKWPWLKTAEHNSSYTLYQALKRSLERRRCGKRDLKRPVKGAKTGSKAGSVNLQKSNRVEALKNEGKGRDFQFSSISGSLFWT